MCVCLDVVCVSVCLNGKMYVLCMRVCLNGWMGVLCVCV